MAAGFDSSPRASKRRKTTYSGQRTVLEDVERDDTPNSHKDQESTSSKENDEPRSTRASGRATRRPRRYSANPDVNHTPHAKTPTKNPSMKEPPKTAPIPKSILTPSKRQRVLPPKTVVFDENEEAIGEQLGFRDIGSIPKKEKHKVVKKARKSTEPDDQDEAIAVTTSVTPPSTSDVGFEDILADEPEIVPDPLPLSVPNSNIITPHADHPGLVQIKRQVLARLTTRTLTPPSHLESQYTTINTLLTSTVTAGESNSLLLLGPRGSGKSLLIESALSELNRSHSDDFHTVRLNGFFQTDDRLALREIWRQLGREMQVNEDEVDEVSSYADTMASLLSLLAHPDDFATDAAPAQANADTKKSSKSVVFVLDEFDLFTTHPRQTLLYNLFDIAQSRKAPIAVLGCSTRTDVVDCLEKRVKSRYSHRWIHVPLAKSLAVFEESVKAVLLVDEHENPGKLSFSTQDIKEHKQYCQSWNEYIKTIFLPNKDTQALIKEHFYTTKSLPNLFIAIYPLIASVSLPPAPTSATPTVPSTLSKAASTTPSTTSPSLTNLLPSLPTLHLSLLTAATRLETIHSLPTINFNLVHAHYAELVERGRQQQAAQSNLAMTSNVLSPAAAGGQSVVGNAGGALRLWGQQTCRAAWEDLGRWNLVVPAAGGSVAAGDEGVGAGHEVDSRMSRCDVILEEVLWGVREKWKEGEDAGIVLGKWCTEI